MTNAEADPGLIESVINGRIKGLQIFLNLSEKDRDRTNAEMEYAIEQVSGLKEILNHKFEQDLKNKSVNETLDKAVSRFDNGNYNGQTVKHILNSLRPDKKITHGDKK